MVLQDQWDLVVQLAEENEEVFAGHWWDNTTDPVTIVLALTDVEAPVADQARRAVPYPAQLRIVTAQRAMRELERIADRVRPDLPDGVGLWINTVRNAVVVSQDPSDPAIDPDLVQRWGKAVTFERTTFQYAPRDPHGPQR